MRRTGRRWSWAAVIVAVVATAAPVLGATAAELAHRRADEPAPPRPAALSSMTFYRSLFGVTADGSLRTRTAHGNPVWPVIPEPERTYLAKSPQPQPPPPPTRPVAPTLTPKVVLHPPGVDTFTSPVPPLRLAGTSSMSCTQLVHTINGATSACILPTSPQFREVTSEPGAPTQQVAGFTDLATGQVRISTAVPSFYLVSVALHERGHQEVQLHCLGPLCETALLKATGNAGRSSLLAGPYFTEAHEVAAESYAVCHGAIPDYRYRIISCAALDAVFALSAQDEANYRQGQAQNARITAANDRLLAAYQQQLAAYDVALAAQQKAAQTYPLERQLWVQVHAFDQAG